ncbi:iron-sulfur cluster assembly scaffold protein [Candidatus Woesearchaeota archaeon]|nr:MAG: iron-sulfur cluster assembly scaffold protein [Candidatus Woesearchaeota archaeon]
MKLKLEETPNVKSKNQAESWFYSDEVKEHFFHPKNIFTSEEEIKKFNADGVGKVGSPACGDMMEMWIKVKDDRIVECRWRTFGCASAIASTSILSVMVTENGGMKLDDALKIRPQDIIKRLGGLPKRKIHCSVLGDKALRAAINDYFKKTKQYDRIVVEGAKVIDKITKVTDKDIEEAVLDGAVTFEEVQEKTKVGIHDKSCIPEVKELIEHYKKKYYGE